MINARQGWTYTAIVELARQHFNERNPLVVPELANDEFRACNVTLSSQTVLDTQQSSTSTLRRLLRTYNKEPNFYQNVTDTTASASSSPRRRVCTAALGPITDGVVAATSGSTLALDVPQLVFTGLNKKSSKEPHVVGMGGTAQYLASAMVDYLKLRNREYLVVYHDSAPHTSALATSIAAAATATGAAADTNLKVTLIQRISAVGPGLGSPPSSLQNSQSPSSANAPLQIALRNDLQKIRQSGIKTVMFTFSVDTMKTLIPLMDEVGLLSPDYMFLWQPAQSHVPVQHFGQWWEATNNSEPLHAGSSMARFLAGTLVFANLDGYMRQNHDDLQQKDRLWMALQQQDASFRTQVNNLVPPLTTSSGGIDTEASDPITQVDQNIFNSAPPEDLSSFLYDTTIAVGMGACRAQQLSKMQASSEKSETNNGPIPTKQNPPSSKPSSDEEDYPLVRGIQSLSFQGASGRVEFPPSSRLRKEVPVGAFNVVSEIVNATSEIVHFSLRLTSWRASKKWTDVPDSPFIYRSGLLEPPNIQIEVQEANYLPTYVRTIGFTLLGITWATTGFFGVAVVYMRNDRLLRSAQPVFLLTVCVGSMILASSILTLSFDEGIDGWSQRRLEVACQITPWMFFVGHVLSFSAMFTRLWRVDRVLQFRRVQVKISQVIGPLAALLIATITILTAWTIVDPWTWERATIHELPLETYGECQSDNFLAYFAPLAGIIILVEGLSVYFALRTTDVPAQFRETNTVFYSIFTNLQAWLLGLPILTVIGTSSAEATYLGRISLVFIFSISTSWIVVAPRVYQAIRIRLNPSLESQQHRVTISGLSSPHDSTMSGVISEKAPMICPNCQAIIAEQPKSSSPDSRTSDASLNATFRGGSRALDDNGVLNQSTSLAGNPAVSSY